MYQSPIDVIMGQMNMTIENEICKAVQNVGVNVDKEELLKALQYDRGQYQKGYRDRDDEIVRCKDCKYHAPDMCCNHPIEWNNGESRNHCNPNWFCADGER